MNENDGSGRDVAISGTNAVFGATIGVLDIATMHDVIDTAPARFHIVERIGARWTGAFVWPWMGRSTERCHQTEYSKGEDPK